MTRSVEVAPEPLMGSVPPGGGDSPAALDRRLTPGLTLLATHVGLDDAERVALVDLDTDAGLPR